MAVERISTKSRRFHISTIATKYFRFLKEKNILPSNVSLIAVIGIAAIPAFASFFLVKYLPGLLLFFVYLLSLWICLGCPVTRQTYKRYLNAAQNGNAEACSLYSESFGNKGGQLSEVGKQLVRVNYRQYASVIIFFVLLGLPGMLFYSIVKEWYFYCDAQANLQKAGTEEKQEYAHANLREAQQVLNMLDIVPVRITAFGFLLMGHFSRGIQAYVNTFTHFEMNAYDLLATVAKASEEKVVSDKPFLDEPLQMVTLVKRNIMFLLVSISVLTLVGLVA